MFDDDVIMCHIKQCHNHLGRLFIYWHPAEYHYCMSAKQTKAAWYNFSGQKFLSGCQACVNPKDVGLGQGGVWFSYFSKLSLTLIKEEVLVYIKEYIQNKRPQYQYIKQI